MKRIIYTALVVYFYAIGAIAQDKIEGIGKIKIGKTTLAIIDELKADGVFVKEMKPDSLRPYSVPFASFCTDVQVFGFGSFKVAGIELKYPFMKFYKGILFDFYCDGSTELSDALKIKYANAKLKVERKPVNCTYKANGNAVQYEEYKSESVLENGSILGVDVFRKYYDSDCEVNYIRYLHIYDIQIGAENDSCNNKALTLIKNKQAQASKEKLKDF